MKIFPLLLINFFLWSIVSLFSQNFEQETAISLPSSVKVNSTVVEQNSSPLMMLSRGEGVKKNDSPLNATTRDPREPAGRATSSDLDNMSNEGDLTERATIATGSGARGEVSLAAASADAVHDELSDSSDEEGWIRYSLSSFQQRVPTAAIEESFDVQPILHESEAAFLHQQASELNKKLMCDRDLVLRSSDEDAIVLWPEIRSRARKAEEAWNAAVKAYQKELFQSTRGLDEPLRERIESATNEARKKAVAQLYYKARQKECELRLAGETSTNLVSEIWKQIAQACDEVLEEAPEQFKADWRARGDEARANATSEIRQRSVSSVERSFSSGTTAGIRKIFSGIQRSSSQQSVEDQKQADIQAMADQVEIEQRFLRDMYSKDQEGNPIIDQEMRDRQERAIQTAFKEAAFAKARLLYAWQKNALNPFKHLSGNFVKKIDEALALEKGASKKYAKLVAADAQVDAQSKDSQRYEAWQKRIAVGEDIVAHTRRMKHRAEGFVGVMQARWTHARMKFILEADRAAVKAAVWSHGVDESERNTIAESENHNARASLVSVPLDELDEAEEDHWVERATLSPTRSRSTADSVSMESKDSNEGRYSDGVRPRLLSDIERVAEDAEAERAAARAHYATQINMRPEMIDYQNDLIARAFGNANIARVEYWKGRDTASIMFPMSSYQQALEVEAAARKKYAQQMMEVAKSNAATGEYSLYGEWQKRIAVDKMVALEAASIKEAFKKGNSADKRKSKLNHERAEAILQADEKAFQAAWPTGPTGI